MKKSLLVTSVFPPTSGGMEDYLYNIAKRLPQDKISVLAPTYTIEGKKLDYKDFDSKQNFKIYRKRFFFPRFIKPGWLPMIRNCLRIAKEEKIELIQCGQCYPTGLAGLYAKKRQNIPYIVYVHGLDLVGFLGKVPRERRIKAILENADKIVANSNYTKDLILKLGDYSKKIEIINPALDLKKYLEIDKTEARAKLGFQDEKIILTVGRLVKRKGFDMIIKSLPKICKEILDVLYVIVGSGSYEDELKNLVKKFKLEDKVRFEGRVEDKVLPYYYAACDVFCMPSRFVKEEGSVEGFGIVYLEAGLYEKAVVGGRTGGVEDAVVDGQTGILVDPENVNEIAQALIKLLTDQELSNKLGVQGRERVLKDFDWDKQIEKVKNLLK